MKELRRTETIGRNWMPPPDGEAFRRFKTRHIIAIVMVMVMVATIGLLSGLVSWLVQR